MRLSKLAESFVLGGPHFDAGFYFDRPNSSADLTALCTMVQAMSGVLPVAAIVAVSDTFPKYGGIVYGLDVPIVTIAITDFEDPLPPGRQLLRGSLTSPDVGPIVVDNQTVDPELLDKIWHPLKVTINGDCLELGEMFDDLSNEEELRRNAQARFLIDAFQQGCETFKPLYGFLSGEEPVPTPIDLMSRNVGSGNIFLSDRLLFADPDLSSLLDSAYAKGFSARWRHGSYYSSWAPLNPAKRSTANPFQSNTSVRQAFRRALASVAGV